MTNQSEPSKTRLEQLLAYPESDWLDFKEAYGRNRAKLVHDILCLSNSAHDKTRFLIFGVQDQTKNIVDISNDEFRLTAAKVTDLLANAKINHLPQIRVDTEIHDNKEVDILSIKNSRNKPFRLLADYVHEGTTVRAGAVYTRNGDRNTPINETANDAEIKLMYLEGLGLNLSPSERFDLYLKDTNGWKYVEGGESPYFFYKRHPEFQVIENNEREFDEDWVRQFPDPSAFLTKYSLSYLGIGLDQAYCVCCDGGRFFTYLPKSIRFKLNDKEFWSYYLIGKGRAGRLARLFDSMTSDSRCYLDLPAFTSHDQAKTELESDLLKGGIQFPFFTFNQESKLHEIFRNNSYSSIQKSRRG